MATGKVARRTAVEDVRTLLDSPEVAALIDRLAPQGRGRKGFGPRVLVGACLVKALFALPTWTRVAALIAEHPGLQDAIGGSPSVWACYRFTVKLRENQPLLADCLDRVTAALQAEMSGIGVDVAIEAVGSARVIASCMEHVTRGGAVVSVGLPHPSAELTVPALQFAGAGKRLLGSYMGDAVPERDIPLYIGYWREGRLPVELLHTDTKPLAEINEGLDALTAGKVVRRLFQA